MIVLIQKPDHAAPGAENRDYNQQLDSPQLLPIIGENEGSPPVRFDGAQRILDTVRDGPHRFVWILGDRYLNAKAFGGTAFADRFWGTVGCGWKGCGWIG